MYVTENCYYTLTQRGLVLYYVRLLIWSIKIFYRRAGWPVIGYKLDLRGGGGGGGDVCFGGAQDDWNSSLQNLSGV